VNPGVDPDTLSDYRIGFDARILGQPGGRFRLGAGAQLIIRMAAAPITTPTTPFAV